MSDEEEHVDEETKRQRELADRIINGPWPIEMMLQHPVPFGKNELITTLEFQRGRFEFLKDIPITEAPTTGQLMLIASRLCGKHIKVIEALDPDDVQEVLAHAAGFIARCRSGGRRASAT